MDRCGKVSAYEWGHKGSEDVWSDKMKDYREQFAILCENLNKGFTKEDVRKHNNIVQQPVLSAVRRMLRAAFI